jgi:hypothetical protein
LAPVGMKSISSTNEAKIVNKIYFIRGEKVMLDFDLALIYGVETRVLNQAVKRQIHRFPSDFMFQLTQDEFLNLKSQIVISSSESTPLISQNVISSWGGRRTLPYAFTEHGTIMLANVLKSETAIQASIFVVRAFIQLRSIIESNKDLAKKLDELESKYDKQFLIVFEAIKKLIKKDNKPRKEIGYLAK